MIEIINYKKKNYALILRSNFKKKGINFFTSNQSSFQLGYINYKSKHQIKPHYHPRQKKIIYDTNEVLFIKKGKIKVNFLKRKNLKNIFNQKFNIFSWGY